MRRSSLAFVVAVALCAGCVYAPPPGHPVTVSKAPDFERSWDAALGAAEDAGVEIKLADRATGRITGTKGGLAVTIELQPQADRSLKVSFSAPGAQETDPTLKQRWLDAYNRRMGR